MRRTATTIALALLLAACSSTTPTPPTVAGVWTGTIGTQTIAMTLVENAGVVNGAGTMTNTPTGTRALTITGTFTAPAVAATIASGTTQPINLKATLAGATMTGTLTGSGFNGDAIAFSRAP